MRTWAAIFLLCCALPAGAGPCRLRGEPWLETARGAHTLDLRRGESANVYVAAPVWIGAKAVSLSDSGVAGRVPVSACGEVAVRWQRVEPFMEHTNTPAPNHDVDIYANAVVFGPRHGTWIGFDRIEQVTTPLQATGPALAVSDAKPAAVIEAADRGPRAELGVMRLAATVTLGEQTRSTPATLEAAFRYTVRESDDFVGWLTTFFNVPYLFGSAGKGARAQAERYYGADCADVLVAALRRTGSHIEYTSVGGLIDELRRIGPPIDMQPCTATITAGCGASHLRWGSDVRAGDLLALDYVGSEALPRPWDHIVALVEDGGPGGRADGVLGPEDLVADSGDRDGLKLSPLSHQGHVRIQVLRPR